MSADPVVAGDGGAHLPAFEGGFGSSGAPESDVAAMLLSDERAWESELVWSGAAQLPPSSSENAANASGRVATNEVYVTNTSANVAAGVRPGHVDVQSACAGAQRDLQLVDPHASRVEVEAREAEIAQLVSAHRAREDSLESMLREVTQTLQAQMRQAADEQARSLAMPAAREKRKPYAHATAEHAAHAVALPARMPRRARFVTLARDESASS
eukprot:3543994-Pleurochrysis_carterae.AAC.2